MSTLKKAWDWCVWHECGLELMKTQLLGINKPYLRNIVNPNKPLKLVCLALVWLGTDENKNRLFYVFVFN